MSIPILLVIITGAVFFNCIDELKLVQAVSLEPKDDQGTNGEISVLLTNTSVIQPFQISLWIDGTLHQADVWVPWNGHHALFTADLCRQLHLERDACFALGGKVAERLERSLPLEVLEERYLLEENELRMPNVESSFVLDCEHLYKESSPITSWDFRTKELALNCSNHLIWTKRLYDAFLFLTRIMDQCDYRVPSYIVTNWAQVASIYAGFDFSGIPVAKIQSLDPAFLTSATLNPSFPIKKLPDPALDHWMVLELMLRFGNHSLTFHNRIGKEVGEHYQRIGEYSLAFAYWVHSNDLAKEGLDPDEAQRLSQNHYAFMESMVTTLFAKEALPALMDLREAGWRTTSLAPFRPVFLVGMMRSGSSLIEKILSSHSKVAAAGETKCLPNVCPPMYPSSTAENQKKWFEAALSPDEIEKRRQQYFSCIFEQVSQTGMAGVTHIIDKNLYNFRLVGLISILFPEAIVVHCSRNPLDTLISIYSIFFSKTCGVQWFQHDLGEILKYYESQVKAMDQWYSMRSYLRLMTIQYEELTKDLQNQVQRLLVHLDLEYEASCLHFYENSLETDTASHWQVKVPIFNSSVGKWKNFSPHLVQILRERSILETLDRSSNLYKLVLGVMLR